jgi:hypothetical protein
VCPAVVSSATTAHCVAFAACFAVLTARAPHHLHSEADYTLRSTNKQLKSSGAGVGFELASHHTNATAPETDRQCHDSARPCESRGHAHRCSVLNVHGHLKGICRAVGIGIGHTPCAAAASRSSCARCSRCSCCPVLAELPLISAGHMLYSRHPPYRRQIALVGSAQTPASSDVGTRPEGCSQA